MKKPSASPATYDDLVLIVFYGTTSFLQTSFAQNWWGELSPKNIFPNWAGGGVRLGHPILLWGKCWWESCICEKLICEKLVAPFLLFFNSPLCLALIGLIKTEFPNSKIKLIQSLEKKNSDFYSKSLDFVLETVSEEFIGRQSSAKKKLKIKKKAAFNRPNKHFDSHWGRKRNFFDLLWCSLYLSFLLSQKKFLCSLLKHLNQETVKDLIISAEFGDLI